MSNYISFHNHSNYSFLDGMCKIPELVARAKELGMTALGISEHEHLCSLIQFYKECKKQGVKPVLGCETYFSPDFSLKGKNKDVNSHLLILAKNDIGYRNLMKLITEAYQNKYHRARVNVELLDKYKEGLIVTSACLSSPFRKAWLPDDKVQTPAEIWAQEAEKILEIFKDNFFFEIHPYDSDEQREWNSLLREEAKARNIPIICQTDTHYTRKEHHQQHDILLAIQTRSFLDDKDRMKHESDSLYLWSEKELQDYGFSAEEISNTKYIADMCNVTIDMSPKFPSLKMNSIVEIEKICKEELEKQRLTENHIFTDEYEERVKYEIGVINKLGFADYFMVLAEIMNYAEKNNIRKGKARGSSSGSLVCKLLGITDVDPIKHNIPFERFINENRVDPPDVDVDIQDDRRDEVINHIIQKFGREKTANVCTFSKMGVRQAFKDYAFVNRFPFGESNKITDMIPFGCETLEEARSKNRNLDSTIINLVHSFDASKALVNITSIVDSLVGSPRQLSVHAAAMVISPDEITNHVPLMVINDKVVTQYDMKSLKDIGLIKFDILGLKTLTAVSKTLEQIEKQGGNLPILQMLIDKLDSNAVYGMLAEGKTAGCFQIETNGITGLCKRLKISSFEDIVHAISLYRPVVLDSGMMEDYLWNRDNPSEWRLLHNDLTDVLKETHGTILFQEQIMEIAMKFAGFSATEADGLRRGIGRKIPEVIASCKKSFIEGCQKKGYHENTAGDIFRVIESAARYGFNRGHAVSYAYLSYETAYLKYFYPAEFMLSVLNVEETEEKVAQYIQECRDIGIEILPPDVNLSSFCHKFEGKNKIRLGLKIIKGVGEKAANHIEEIRERDGEFTSLEDFLVRHNGSLFNTKALISTCAAGCYDSLNYHRNQLLEPREEDETVLLQAIKKIRKAKAIQYKEKNPLFDLNKVANTVLDINPDADIPSSYDIMRMEKEVFGFYLSNDINKYRQVIEEKTEKWEDFIRYKDKGHCIAGTITNAKIAKMKDKKTEYGRCKLSTLDGESISVSIFGDKFSRSKGYLKDGLLVLVHGKYNEWRGNEGIIAVNITPLTEDILSQGS